MFGVSQTVIMFNVQLFMFRLMLMFVFAMFYYHANDLRAFLSTFIRILQHSIPNHIKFIAYDFFDRFEKNSFADFGFEKSWLASRVCSLGLWEGESSETNSNRNNYYYRHHHFMVRYFSLHTVCGYRESYDMMIFATPTNVLTCHMHFSVISVRLFYAFEA